MVGKKEDQNQMIILAVHRSLIFLSLLLCLVLDEAVLEGWLTSAIKH